MCSNPRKKPLRSHGCKRISAIYRSLPVNSPYAIYTIDWHSTLSFPRPARSALSAQGLCQIVCCSKAIAQRTQLRQRERLFEQQNIASQSVSQSWLPHRVPMSLSWKSPVANSRPPSLPFWIMYPAAPMLSPTPTPASNDGIDRVRAKPARPPTTPDVGSVHVSPNSNSGPALSTASNEANVQRPPCVSISHAM